MPEFIERSQRLVRGKSRLVFVGLVITFVLCGVGVFLVGKGLGWSSPPALAVSGWTPMATGMPTLMVSAKDSMPLVYIPAGKFLMGAAADDKDANLDEKPQHEVSLDAFWIDRTEVTNGMYAVCVAEGVCHKPADTNSSTRTSYYDHPDYADYPVIDVDWFMARNYCRWAGRRLPTEAEWEKAARGTDGRAYPWGIQDPGCDLLNYGGIKGCVGDTSKVGSYPAGTSPYGALDMAGNVWEWVEDWYTDTYYSQSPGSNPQGPSSGTDELLRVLRGGAWGSSEGFVHSADRLTGRSDSRGSTIGFRCAVSE